MVKAAVELNAKWPDCVSRRFHRMPFGDIYAEDAYVYPPFHPAAVAAGAAP